ncbi:MAG: FAD binding domain-containing protein [Acidimicrobiales bacterium]
MIPASFDYERPSSLEEALGLLAEHGDEAKVLAGGHSLLPLMKLRFATPTVVIDVGRLEALSYLRDEGDHLAIGALTTHRDVAGDESIKRYVPLLAHVAGQVGDPQVRQRGTLGGSLAHGDPASDLPAVMLALGATFVATGPQGRREFSADSFFEGFLETALTPEDLLVEVRVPKVDGVGWSFQKLTKRAQDWAIVGAAVLHGDGATGVGLINMGSTPLRAVEVESALQAGASPNDAAALADVDTEPMADLNADESFRRHLAKVLVRRGIEEAVAGVHK